MIVFVVMEGPNRLKIFWSTRSDGSVRLQGGQSVSGRRQHGRTRGGVGPLVRGAEHERLVYITEPVDLRISSLNSVLQLILDALEIQDMRGS